MKNYDLIIVGGGPAGSVAGMTAAEAGLKTLVLERARRPGEKNISGTGLSPKCWRDLPFMKELNLPNMRLSDMATVHLTDEQNKERVNLSFTPSEQAPYPEARRFLTMNVYRSELDPWLASLAVAAGAEVRTSTAVTGVWKEDKRVAGVVLEDDVKLGADAVIGADGINSAVAVSSGLRKRWPPYESGLIVQYNYAAPKERIDEVIGGNALHYWWGATYPVGYTFFDANGFHAGLGCFPEWFKKNPRSYLDTFLKIEGVQRQIRLTGAKPVEYQAHMLPFVSVPGQTHAPGVMLTGDAAGFACPVEAEGVYYAMLSGKLAAETAVEALSDGGATGPAMAAYERRWKDSPVGEEFEPGPEYARFVKDLGFNPDAAKWVVPMLNDALFSLCGVADAHAANVRALEKRLEKYAPPMRKALLEVLLPLNAAIRRSDASRVPEPALRMLQVLAPRLLPPIGRLAGSFKDPPPELAALMVEHFLTPMLKERFRRNGRGG